jgi:hypothetical protein
MPFNPRLLRISFYSYHCILLKNCGFVFCLGRKHKSNTQVVCMLIAKGSLRTIFCRTCVELVPHLLILKVDLLRTFIMFERVTEGTAHRFLSACYGRLIHFVLVQTVFDT